MKIRLFYDPSKCTGCMACQIACMDQRDIRPLEGERPLMYIRGSNTGPYLYQMFRCTNCGSCMEVCPAGAIICDAWGLIQLDASCCIGCGSCKEACPNQVISVIAGHKAKKCDSCIGRILDGRLPACVHTCPTGALTYQKSKDDKSIGE